MRGRASRNVGARRGSPPRLSSPCPELGATFYPLLEAFVERGVPVVRGCPEQGPGQGGQDAGEFLAVGQTGGAIVVGGKDEGVLAVEQLLHAERANPAQLLARRRDGDRGPETHARHAHGEPGSHSGGSLGCGEVAPLAVGGEVGQDIPYRFRGGVDVDDGGEYCIHGGFHFWLVRGGGADSSASGWSTRDRRGRGLTGGWRLRWSAGRGRPGR